MHLKRLLLSRKHKAAMQNKITDIPVMQAVEDQLFMVAYSRVAKSVVLRTVNELQSIDEISHPISSRDGCGFALFQGKSAKHFLADQNYYGQSLTCLKKVNS